MVISDFKLLEKIVQPYGIRNIFHFSSLRGFSIDSRTLKRGQAYIALKGKHCDGHDFIEQAVLRGSKCVIAERYVALKKKVPFFLVEDSYDALRRVCRFIRKEKNPFVYGVTGSVGKSTTKEMLAFLLADSYDLHKSRKTENNLLGLAKTILSLKKEKVMVVEIGTNNKGEISDLCNVCLPNAAVVTFVKPSHLEGLGSLEGVFEEKTSFLKEKRSIRPILNRDDPYLRTLKLTQKIYWVGKDKSNSVYASKVGTDDQGSVFIINDRYELRLPSYQEYFITNALLALAAAALLKIPLGVLVRRLNNFKNTLDGRMQMEENKKICIVNDAYNSNPYSCICALRSFKAYPHKKVAVLADMLELGSKAKQYHVSLAQEVINNKFDYCLTLGTYTTHLQEKLLKEGFKNGHHFSSHKGIAEFINKRVLTSDGKSDEKCLVFLKGSRGMGLEKVVGYL